MKIEMRWLQIAPGNRVLQFKEAYYEDWRNVPVVLDVNEQKTNLPEAYDNLLYKSPPEAESLKKWVEDVEQNAPEPEKPTSYAPHGIWRKL